MDNGKVVARDWGRRGWELVFNGCRISVWEDKNVLEIDGRDGCTTA